MSRGARPRIYLAGPITGLSYAGATDWRTSVSEQLLPEVIGVSPMRGKDYLKNYTELGGTSADFAGLYESHSGHVDAVTRVLVLADESTAKAINCRDRWDVQTCDAVLMNVLGAERVSIGTMIEAGWADSYRKPLILVMEKEGNFHDHGMLDQIAGYRVQTLAEAIHIAKILFWRAP